MLIKYLKKRFAKKRGKPRQYLVENKKPRIDPIINPDLPPEILSVPLDELEFSTNEPEPVWTLETEKVLFSEDDSANKDVEDKQLTVLVSNRKKHDADITVIDNSKVNQLHDQLKQQPATITLKKQKVNDTPVRKVSSERLREKQALRKEQLIQAQEKQKDADENIEKTKAEGLSDPRESSLFQAAYSKSLALDKPISGSNFSRESKDGVLVVPDEFDEEGEDDEIVAWSDVYLEQAVSQQTNETELFSFSDEICNWEDINLIDDDQDLEPVNKNSLSSEDRAWQLASKIAAVDSNWSSEDSNVLVSALLKHNNHWQTRRALTRLLEEYNATPEEIRALLEMREVWKDSQYTRLLKSSGVTGEGWSNLSWGLGLDVLRLLGSDDASEAMFFIEGCFDDWDCSPRLMKGYPYFATYLSHLISHFRRLRRVGVCLLPYADVTSAWLTACDGDDRLNTIMMKEDLEDYGLIPDFPNYSPTWPHISDQLTEKDYAEAIGKRK